jgi:uncharacterized membrane protein (UPF0127 family)
MKHRTMILLVILVIVLILAGILLLWHVVFSKNENPPLPTETLRVGNAVFTVELATTMLQQERGLSFRKDLAPDRGMLFLFGSGSVQNFWMKDMNFPLDMIWISGDKVAGFVQDAKPEPGVSLLDLPIYTSPENVDKVLEVDAGTVAKDGIKVGDPVILGTGTSTAQ